MGLIYLRSAQQHLQEGNVLILAGCFSGDGQDNAWKITGGLAIPDCTEIYKSNAQEADMRVWRHATRSRYRHILIYSPDTDVYNIGLTMPQSNQHVVVQIDLPQNPPKYVDMSKLFHCLTHDPNLASLPQAKLGSIMLQLYIVSGCDSVSYISGLGKTTFLNVFFQHAEFITGAESTGCLSQTQ